MTKTTNRLNYILLGVINQPQIWIKHRDRQLSNFINYLIMGLVNQPQLRIERIGANMEEEEITPTEKKDREVNVHVQGGSPDAVYGLGVIGAAIYYINQGTTGQEKAIGFLKALVWPVYVVKGLLKFLEKV